MASKLEQRVVIVTAASRGIGRSIAEAVLDAGARLVLHAFGDEETTKEAVQLQDAWGMNTVVVMLGDISLPETSTRVA